MNKKFIIPLFMSIIILLSSCTSRGGRVLDTSEDKQADFCMEQILDALKNQDKDALKKLFSEQAVSEAKDFDGNIDYLFEFFQGEVKSSKQDKWSSDEEIDYGKESDMLRAWYTVTTDKNQYIFFIIDYTTDTINPDNAGLYTLRVIKAEDKETQLTYWQDMQIAGIYEPEQ